MAYKYHAEITIDHDKVAYDHSDMVFMVSGVYDGTGGEPDIRTRANGGKVENTVAGGIDDILTIPADLIFSSTSDLSGTDKLNFEIERYDPATGKICAWVHRSTWDKDNDETVYMLYGDSDVVASQESIVSVWSAYYCVYHFHGSAYGEIRDSCNTQSDFNASGGNPTFQQDIDGYDGYCVDFDGNDHINKPSSGTKPLNSDWYESVYVDLDSVSGTDYITKTNANTNNQGHDITNSRFNWYNSSGNSIDHGLSTGSGQYLAMRRDYSEGDAWSYKNGVQHTYESSGWGFYCNPADTVMAWGANKDGNDGIDGRVAEYRIIKSLSSANWAETEANTFDPSTFYTMGQEQGGAAGRLAMIGGNF